MKKSLIFLIMICVSLLTFSLSFANFANFAGPQLEFISNGFDGLWDRPTEDIRWMMNLFPDYECTDYPGQFVCSSRFNTGDQNNIYINFFTDDYEKKHDNLWKVSVTVDVQSAEEFQTLFEVLWNEGMKPVHTGNEEEFSYKGVQPLFFENQKTRMVAYFQEFDPDNNSFFLVEYYMK
ncbi:MAG: hypothetical protein IKP86_10950 [Anaerolineaceae bacterium]|nr:hypothetical protein [Anaerolineaceae bacterium]